VRALKWIPFAVIVTLAFMSGRSRLPVPTTVPLDAAMEARLQAEHRSLEREWVQRASHSFPGDLWSQGDDLANAERRWASDFAGTRSLAIADVLLAIDAGLRDTATTSPERGIVAPCMPRPFYE
jgi:hypothetical protein